MMTTKRVIATSVLVAFMVILSSILALLPQAISPQTAQAETVQTAFAAVGTTTWTVPASVSSIQVLVVAGGGGGGGVGWDRGYSGGGGGGAGGAVYNANYAVTPGTSITVTVGAGGAGGAGQTGGGLGSNGGNSAFDSITATGGGGGGSGGNSASSIGLNGGSGGGGGGRTVTSTDYAGGTATPSGQGNNGGKGNSYSFDILQIYDEVASGGGGGAGGVGGSASDYTPGNGGPGVNYSSIFSSGVGVSGWFAGGGGGACYGTSGTASHGGGAGGRNADATPDNGTPNTGGGGGGAYCNGQNHSGGNGGSGIIIIKYVTNDPPVIGYTSAPAIVIYDAVGSYTFTPPAGTTQVEYLVIGGGGGGGGVGEGSFGGAGGGGAGGFRTGTYALTPLQPYTIVVGAGGSAGVNYVKGGSGGDSSFATITANGGGGGASGPEPDNSGIAGGSGGGGRWDSAGLGGAGNTPSTDPSQGNKGGNGGSYGAGGGGGASVAGANGNGNNGGAGGAGRTSSISGTSVTYAGGGGGGGYGAAGGAGGSGGGGSAPASRGAGNPGINGLGGGGGGATGSSSGNAYSGGAGGSGIVIIKYTVATVVALWTTEGSPTETESLIPRLEFNIKIPVTDSNTLNDLSTLKAIIYYDSNGSYNESEVPFAGDTQICAILTWTNGGSPAWTMDAGSGTSWTIETANCVQPTLTETTGTFEFHFKPGKVATQTTDPAKWHIYAKATDSFANTGTGIKQNVTMAWYGEVIVNNAGVAWGLVPAGTDFTEGDPSEETGISITYISNGAYNQQVSSSATWTDGGSNTATLNIDGNPGANEFSLKADDDGTLEEAITVSDSYRTFDTGVITPEGGNIEAFNSLWLRLGTSLAEAIYSGTIYYQISQ